MAESNGDETSSSVVCKEYKAWEYKEASILGNEDQIIGADDVQEEEVDELMKVTLDEKNAMPLPTLYVEDGPVILQFSEIFAVHKPPQKRDKKENRYITNRDIYKYMDLVEDDEEVLLKSHGRTDTHVNQADLILAFLKKMKSTTRRNQTCNVDTWHVSHGLLQHMVKLILCFV